MTSPKNWSNASDSDVIDAYVTSKKLTDALKEILESRAARMSPARDGPNIICPSGATFKIVRRSDTYIDKEKLVQWAEMNDIQLPMVVDCDEKRLAAHFGKEFVANIKDAGLTRTRVSEYYVAKPSVSRRNTGKGEPKILPSADTPESEDG